MGNARVAKEYIETLASGSSNARVAKEYLEVIYFASSAARVAHEYLEIVCSGNDSPEIIEDELTDTITLTDEFLATNGSLSDELTLSETITPTLVVNAELSDSLTLTETIIFSGLEDILTLTDDVTGFTQRIGSWTDTLTLTETLLYNTVQNRVVGDALEFAEQLQETIVQLISFSDTLTFVDDLTGVAVKVLGDSMTFSDALTAFIAKVIHDDIEFGETLSPQTVLNHSMVDQLVVYDSLAVSLFSQISLAETLVLTDTMIGSVTRPLETDTLTFSESILSNTSKPISDTVNFTDSVTYTKNIIGTLSDTLTLTDDAVVKLVLTRQLAETLDFVESYLGIRNRFGSMTDTLTLTDEIVREVHTEPLDESIVLADTLVYQKIGSRTLTETLSFSETLGSVNDFVRDLTDTIVFTDGFVVKANRRNPTGINDIRPVPDSDPVIYEGVIDVMPQLTMVGHSLSIVLPPPEFNDFVANQGKIAVQRSMTGRFRVYAKRTQREKVNWRFVIPKYKADELRQFLLAEIDHDLRVWDWEGNFWVLKLLSDSVDFIEAGRWGGCGNKFEVTLELVGFKYA